MKEAPMGYTPHLFCCEKKSKAPKVELGSWKDIENRLSGHEAVAWLENNGNVGIAGMPDDPLINVDIDDEERTKKEDLKPTLMARSRSRTGLHAWYFSDDEIPNIPTDDAGEIRAQGQYVVAPGSYVPCPKSDLEEKVVKGEITEVEMKKVLDDSNRGDYTVEEKTPVSSITLDDLPEVFKEVRKEVENQEPKEPGKDFDPKETDGDKSALFDIDAREIVLREGGSTKPTDRWTAIFHDSSTDMNMSLSSEGLLHCWRHSVSHNGLQALTVLSGYLSCREAGSGHKNSGAGRSQIINDNGAIFHAWKYAKRRGYIPDDDPIPTKALNHVAKIEGIYNATGDELLPKPAYNRTLKAVEEKY